MAIYIPKCRYTKTQYESLGYDPTVIGTRVNFATEENAEVISGSVKGKFISVINALFDSKDGSLDNAVDKYVSENAPESVRSFVQNVLLQETQPLPSAPDDATAFDTLIPRSVSTMAEIAPYLDHIKRVAETSKLSDNGNT